MILSHNLLVEKNLALAMIMIDTDLKPDYHTYLGGFFILFFLRWGFTIYLRLALILKQSSCLTQSSEYWDYRYAHDIKCF